MRGKRKLKQWRSEEAQGCDTQAEKWRIVERLVMCAIAGGLQLKVFHFPLKALHIKLGTAKKKKKRASEA